MTAFTEDRKLIEQIKSDFIYFGMFAVEVTRSKKGVITGFKRVNPLNVHISRPKKKRKKR